MINKYHNQQYSSGIPLRTGDRRYSQDRVRDFWFLMDMLGLAFRDVYGKDKAVISGGVVTQGYGLSLNITAGFGYASFEVDIPDSFSSMPPSVTSEDIEAIRIAWTVQTSMNGSSSHCSSFSTVDDSSTPNYVKVSFKETDGNSRNKAKASGSYAYETVPDFDFTVDSTPPTDYELELGKFTSDGTTYTFLDSTDDRLDYSTLKDLSDAMPSGTSDTFSLEAGEAISKGDVLIEIGGVAYKFKYVPRFSFSGPIEGTTDGYYTGGGSVITAMTASSVLEVYTKTGAGTDGFMRGHKINGLESIASSEAEYKDSTTYRNAGIKSIDSSRAFIAHESTGGYLYAMVCYDYRDIPTQDSAEILTLLTGAGNGNEIDVFVRSKSYAYILYDETDGSGGGEIKLQKISLGTDDTITAFGSALTVASTSGELNDELQLHWLGGDKFAVTYRKSSTQSAHIILFETAEGVASLSVLGTLQIASSGANASRCLAMSSKRLLYTITSSTGVTDFYLIDVSGSTPSIVTTDTAIDTYDTDTVAPTLGWVSPNCFTVLFKAVGSTGHMNTYGIDPDENFELIDFIIFTSSNIDHCRTIMTNLAESHLVAAHEGTGDDGIIEIFKGSENLYSKALCIATENASAGSTFTAMKKGELDLSGVKTLVSGDRYYITTMGGIENVSPANLMNGRDNPVWQPSVKEAGVALSSTILAVDIK